MRVAVCVTLTLVLTGCGSGRSQAQEPGAAGTAHPQRYAVLANADSARDHEGNVACAYRTLRALGFDEENIFVVSPKDRRNPPAKRTPVCSPVPAHFAQVMDRLASLTHAGDTVVIYGTGHGDYDRRGVFLELRHGRLWPADLRAEVERLPANVIVIMDQCFSGGFVEAFEGTRSRAIVISDVDSKHETYCKYFAETFWDAFLKDHKTSVRQAYEAAMKIHQKELADDPDLKTDGEYRFFNGFTDVTLN
ncbi:MAG: hypothetical protein ABSH46_02145 [Bryobacteraceae bacterium]|jgi:hypothetical protein